MIYVFLADGFEEVEAVTPIDYLRRAGKNVVTVCVSADENRMVTGAHAIAVTCDISETDVVLSDELEGIVLPGGMPGTLNLEKSAAVQDALAFCQRQEKLIAAICAAPSILGHKNLLQGKNATCFPGFEKELAGAVLSKEFAVTDGNIITAKGAGSACEFAFELIAYFCGRKKADEVKKTVQSCY